MTAWTGYVLVFVGAGLGGSLRHAVNLVAQRLSGMGPAIGTMGINVLGSLLMGVMAAWLASASGQREPIRLLLATGVLGGFTTFSAFSLDALGLWQRGDLAAAGSYVLGTVGLSLLAVVVGLGVGTRLLT